MDHSYSCEFENDIYNIEVADNNTLNDMDDVKVDEKVGDDYLIDLYRERRFLYDKRDKTFKDNAMKENAWVEISKIMREKNCGDYYTAEYCQKRIRSLREKFSRLQKMEQNYKSGSAAPTEKRSPLLNQLSFLNTYIQRRRTYSNVKENIKEEPDNVKENSDNSTSDNEVVSKKQILENKTLSNKKIVEKTTDETKDNKCLKRKTDEENILNVITNLSNSILSESSQTPSKLRTAESVFAEYIALELERMNEPEKSVKKQKLMEVLSMPVEKIFTTCKHCCQHEIFAHSIMAFHRLCNHSWSNLLKCKEKKNTNNLKKM